MQALARQALNTYAALELETGVAGASPQQLIVMLYDGALKAIFGARAAIGRNEIALKGACVSKAIAIIDQGLRPALDMEAGGEIAANLDALYDYVCTRLLYANLKNDLASLDEAARLLSELKGAWDALELQDRPAAEPAVAPPQKRAPTSLGKA
jgi:flagellar protein FliS